MFHKCLYILYSKLLHYGEQKNEMEMKTEIYRDYTKSNQKKVLF